VSRDLRVTGVTVDRPDERATAPANRVGPSVAFTIISEDLKRRPVHVVRIGRREALRLLADLARACAVEDVAE
jgi:hypothetical protein